MPHILKLRQDYGDLSGDLEAGDRVKATFEMTARVAELEQAGFWVFGGREIRRFEGGVGPPSPFPLAILHVRRATSRDIIKVDLTRATEPGPEPAPSDTMPTSRTSDV